MPFVKGKSGNPQGRAKERPWQRAIERAIERSGTGNIDYSALDEAADALLAAAKQGDVPALKELGDRLDGKAQQFIDMTVAQRPEARVYPRGLNDPTVPGLPTASEAVDSVH